MGKKRVPADDILKQAEKLGLLDVLKRLVKQGQKLDDIDLDTLRAAARKADPPRRFDRDDLGSRMPVHGANGDRTTYGRAVDSNGREHSTRSGHKSEDREQIEAVNERLRERGMPYRASGNAHHAEQKFAARMHNEGIDDADLVINNPQGPCTTRLGCDESIPRLLGPNQRLRVHWRDENGNWQMTPYEGAP